MINKMTGQKEELLKAGEMLLLLENFSYLSVTLLYIP